jgi:hypothetical protein
MGRHFGILVGLLLAGPALAADGSYSGSGVYVSGSGTNCQGTDWRLTIEGTAVRAKLIPPRLAPNKIRDIAGTMDTDGTIRMSYVTTYGDASGKVDIELKLEGDTISGFSQSQSCRYRITLQRN